MWSETWSILPWRLLGMPPPRPAARTFRDLLVWRKAHDFVLAVYWYTATFPRQENYGLVADAPRRDLHGPPTWPWASRSGRNRRRPRYLNIAEGSVEECRYYLILAQDLGYSETEALAGALDEVSRLLSAYVRAILASRS